jgi:hypothetical protein
VILLLTVIFIFDADDCSLFLPVSPNDDLKTSTVLIQEDLDRLHYADDCSLFLPVSPNDDLKTSTVLIQEDLDRLHNWSNLWKLYFKAEKSKEVFFHSTHQVVANFPNLHIGTDIIPVGSSHSKHLGLILDNKLTFEEHLTHSHIICKCNLLLNPLKSLKHTIQSKHLERLYFAFVLPHLEYGSINFAMANSGILAKLDQIHYALIVSWCIWGTNTTKVLMCLGWMSLEQRRNEKKLMLMYDVESNGLPPYILNNFVQ